MKFTGFFCGLDAITIQQLNLYWCLLISMEKAIECFYYNKRYILLKWLF